MTRDEAESILTTAGEAGDADFPLLEAAIACAIHDYPFRDPEPVRTLARNACERLAERIGGEGPDCRHRCSGHAHSELTDHRFSSADCDHDAQKCGQTRVILS